MKKFMLMASLVSVVVSALALPALAQNRFSDDRQDSLQERQDRFEDFWERFYADDNRWEDDNWWEDDNRFEDDANDFAPAVQQSFDQEVVSGDVQQSFNVGNGGDNSNQCVGINSSVNTGNIQNQTGLIQYGSEIGDFEIEDSGSSINVGGTSTTRCDQQVNQAAAAG